MPFTPAALRFFDARCWLTGICTACLDCGEDANAASLMQCCVSPYDQAGNSVHAERHSSKRRYVRSASLVRGGALLAASTTYPHDDLHRLDDTRPRAPGSPS